MSPSSLSSSQVVVRGPPPKIRPARPQHNTTQNTAQRGGVAGRSGAAAAARLGRKGKKKYVKVADGGANLPKLKLGLLREQVVQNPNSIFACVEWEMSRRRPRHGISFASAPPAPAPSLCSRQQPGPRAVSRSCGGSGLRSLSRFLSPCTPYPSPLKPQRLFSGESVQLARPVQQVPRINA